MVVAPKEGSSQAHKEPHMRVAPKEGSSQAHKEALCALSRARWPALALAAKLALLTRLAGGYNDWRGVKGENVERAKEEERAKMARARKASVAAGAAGGVSRASRSQGGDMAVMRRSHAAIAWRLHDGCMTITWRLHDDHMAETRDNAGH